MFCSLCVYASPTRVLTCDLGVIPTPIVEVLIEDRGGFQEKRYPVIIFHVTIVDDFVSRLED